ncbi:hypothetical protein LguiA_029519 [Lonicera macranthoides]
MIFSVLCCITAAKVEIRRIGVIRSHGLLDKPKEDIPMSLFWLLPQYLLLAALDGFSQASITGFFENQAPPSMKKYLLYFTNGVLGLGTMGSVLSVYIVGKVSEKGGITNWFRDNLNESRLDRYYWTLAGLSAVNLVVYILVASFYSYRESQVEGDTVGAENSESIPPFEDNVQWIELHGFRLIPARGACLPLAKHYFDDAENRPWKLQVDSKIVPVAVFYHWDMLLICLVQVSKGLGYMNFFELLKFSMRMHCDKNEEEEEEEEEDDDDCY